MKKPKNFTKKSKALALLRKVGCSEEVIKHCVAVSKLSLKIARELKEKGFDVDVNFVEVAALLHDIGRAKTHGIFHGVEGGKILRKFKLPEKFARVCENHLGGGISKDEAIKVGLPKRDFIPETLEEKIIAHADNLISGDKVVPIEKTIDKLKKELGEEGHPAILRVLALAEEIERPMSKSKSR